ncbi:MAG: hypothetical protein JWP37_3057 [Mucilaginibacter sp.]|nr:hypothetical protein [Mucilaginibacter sp.]
MKKSITLAALLLFGIGVSSTAFAKPKSHKISAHEQVSLIPLREYKGFAVMVDKRVPGKSLVMIYDKDNNVVFKDLLTKGTKAEKKYILSDLDNGDYKVEVFSKGHDIKTQFYVYHAGQKKIIRLS